MLWIVSFRISFISLLFPYVSRHFPYNPDRKTLARVVFPYSVKSRVKLHDIYYCRSIRASSFPEWLFLGVLFRTQPREINCFDFRKWKMNDARFIIVNGQWIKRRIDVWLKNVILYQLRQVNMYLCGSFVHECPERNTRSKYLITFCRWITWNTLELVASGSHVCRTFIRRYADCRIINGVIGSVRNVLRHCKAVENEWGLATLLD